MYIYRKISDQKLKIQEVLFVSRNLDDLFSASTTEPGRKAANVELVISYYFSFGI
jgi:hypothetical protein